MATRLSRVPQAGVEQPFQQNGPKWFLAITCTICHHLEFWRRGFAWFFGPHLFGFGSQGQTLGPGDKICQKTLFWTHVGSFFCPGRPIFKKKNVDKATLLTWGHGLGHGQGHALGHGHGPWPWPMAMAMAISYWPFVGPTGVGGMAEGP